LYDFSKSLNSPIALKYNSYSAAYYYSTPNHTVGGNYRK